MYFQEDSIVFLDGSWIEAKKQILVSLAKPCIMAGAFDGMRSYKNAEGCNICKRAF